MSDNPINVTGSIIIEDGKVLLVQETKVGIQGKWGWPGGTEEPGETIEQTAIREIMEESGYSVNLGRKLGVWYHEGDNKNVHVWLADIDHTVPQSIGAHTAQWWTFDEVKQRHDEFRAPLVYQVIESVINK